MEQEMGKVEGRDQIHFHFMNYAVAELLFNAGASSAVLLQIKWLKYILQAFVFAVV